MKAVWIRVKIKPEMREKFLHAIEVDALGSERDEAGCVRFNVMQDLHDEDVYYLHEIYVDDTAQQAHRETPHYAVWKAAADTLAEPLTRFEATPVIPSDPGYWRKTD